MTSKNGGTLQWFRKPCKETLQYASEHLHIDFDEILFIGDEEKNLCTAENAVCDFMYIDNFLKTYGIQKENWIVSEQGVHLYANVNYSLLGEVIEAVSGTSYEEYVTEYPESIYDR